MLITVAICTFNRADLLKQTLDAVFEQSLAPDEVLVVDNASTDNTKEVVQHAQRETPLPVRYVLEPAPGVAHARNRAVTEAKGMYLAFVDDDAFPKENWLASLFGSLNSVTTPLSCVVGKVELNWHKQRPNWFPQHLEPLLCAYDQGSLPRLLGENDYLLTTNVLFQTSVLNELGGFKPYLGRKRDQMLGGEDNEIHARLIRTGHRILYQPSAIVYHHVSEERRSRWFLLRRVYWNGASQPLLAYADADSENRQYAATSELKRDTRRLVRLMLELIYTSAPGLSLFERLLRIVERSGRFRTNLALAWRNWRDN